jgi:hypothetical protein
LALVVFLLGEEGTARIVARVGYLFGGGDLVEDLDLGFGERFVRAAEWGVADLLRV